MSVYVYRAAAVTMQMEHQFTILLLLFKKIEREKTVRCVALDELIFNFNECSLWISIRVCRVHIWYRIWDRHTYTHTHKRTLESRSLAFYFVLKWRWLQTMYIVYECARIQCIVMSNKEKNRDIWEWILITSSSFCPNENKIIDN